MIGAGVVAGFLLLAVPQQSRDSGDELERAAEEAAEEFRGEFDRPDLKEDERVLLIRRLGRISHPKTLQALAPHLTKGSMAVRIAAAMVLENFRKVPDATRELVKAYRHVANQVPAARAVRIRILQTLGALRDPTGVEIVNAAIVYWDPWIARAGARAAAQIRHRSSIDPLLQKLRRIEKRPGEGGKSGPAAPETGRDLPERDERDGDGAGRKDRTLSAAEILRPAVDEALQSITYQNFSSYEDWARWWNSARRHFEVP